MVSPILCGRPVTVDKCEPIPVPEGAARIDCDRTKCRLVCNEGMLPIGTVYIDTVSAYCTYCINWKKLDEHRPDVSIQRKGDFTGVASYYNVSRVITIH